jgi:formylglycine-generating enzyme required for sulfatase activity
MTDKKTNIGGIEISDVKGSNLTIEGDITTKIDTGGGDIIGRDKITYIHYHTREGEAVEIPPLPFEPDTILIPSGPFVMGSDDGEAYEGPQHEVTLDSYCIGKYPVTHRQYAEFIKQVRKYHSPKRAGWERREPPPDRLDHPVVGVSWYEAQAYCQWLSEQTQRTRIYRLPSEAEWEKAARGLDGRLYPWGNDWTATYCNVGSEGTTPVIKDTQEDTPYYADGVSPYGCGDMLGNVQEWAGSPWGSDPYENEFGYPFDPDDQREAIAATHYHVFRIHRGRSFRDEPHKVRCSNRGYASPDSKVRWRGFRVVLEVKHEEG